MQTERIRGRGMSQEQSSYYMCLGVAGIIVVVSFLFGFIGSWRNAREKRRTTSKSGVVSARKSNWKWWLLAIGVFRSIGANTTPESAYSGQFAADMFFGGMSLFVLGLVIDTIRIEIWKKPGMAPRSKLKWWLLGVGFWMSLGNWFSQPPLFFAPFILYDFIGNMFWGFVIGFVVDLVLDLIQKKNREAVINRKPQAEVSKTSDISGEVVEIDGKYYHVKKIKDGEPKSD